MTRKLFAALCGLMLLGGWQGACAQENPPQKRRPRIGLALAGGSARGLTHIGVLKWFAENRIPIDYVAGTSMGGLVGGIYAVGKSPEEIEAFLQSLEWKEIFQSEAPHMDKSFRRKEDDVAFPSSLAFGLKNGLRLPSAVVPGHDIELVIARFAAPYSGMKTFNDLPTPFQCVAVDLAEGKQMVWKEGDLTTALRSTMSLPAVFSPVRNDKKVLVDGGLLNNLPVDVVKAMGADIVIAVVLLEFQHKDYASESMLGVASRSIDVMIDENERRNMQAADMLLTPDLSGLMSSDFDLVSVFVERGYQEAARKAQFLKTLAVDAGEWNAYLAGRRERQRIGPITPQFVEVAGVDARRQKALEKKFGKLVGKPLDTAALEKQLTPVSGMGLYEAAGYTFVNRGGQDGLHVAVRERSHAPPVLNLLLGANGASGDEVNFDFAGRLTLMDVGGFNSEWRTDFAIGNPNRVASEFYYRVMGGPVFIAPRGFLDFGREGVFQGDNRIAEYALQQMGGGVDAGFLLGRSTELRVGYEANHIDAHVRTGAPTLPSVDGLFHSIRARWVTDYLDSPTVPHKGFLFLTQLNAIYDGPQIQDFVPVIESRLIVAHPVSKRFFVIGQMAGGTTASEHPPFPVFDLGGPLQLSALRRGEQRGNNFYFTSLSLLRPLSDRPLDILGKTYVVFRYEMGNAFNHIAAASSYHDGAIGMLSETPLGIIFIGGSFGENGKGRVFFRLGRLF